MAPLYRPIYVPSRAFASASGDNAEGVRLHRLRLDPRHRGQSQEQSAPQSTTAAAAASAAATSASASAVAAATATNAEVIPAASMNEADLAPNQPGDIFFISVPLDIAGGQTATTTTATTTTWRLPAYQEILENDEGCVRCAADAQPRSDNNNRFEYRHSSSEPFRHLFV